MNILKYSFSLYINNSVFVNILISSTNNIIPRAGHTPHSRISAKYWSCVMSHLSRFGDEKFIIKVTRWRESSLRVSPTRHFHQKVLFWYQNYLEKCSLYSPWLFFSSLPSDSRISSSRWQRAVALNNIIVETYSLSKLIQDYQRSPHHVLQTPHSFIITVCTSGSWARVCALKQLPVPERTCRASSWTRSSSCVSSLLTRGSASEIRMNSVAVLKYNILLLIYLNQDIVSSIDHCFPIPSLLLRMNDHLKLLSF